MTMIVSALLCAVILSATQLAYAAADETITKEVVKHCQEKAPKAKNSCAAAATDSLNKASYNCEGAKKPDSCVQSKAKAYITKAAKGNPNDSKFKSQLDAVLDKVKGNRNSYNADISSGSAASDKASVFGAGKVKDNVCGNLDDNTKNVYTDFNFGCLGPEAPDGTGPIQDLAYALIRFMSAGVGIVVVASIVLAGIQYSTSEGNPEATQSAKNRIRDAMLGLLLYIFAFSLIQYLVPGGVFAGTIIVDPHIIVNGIFK